MASDLEFRIGAELSELKKALAQVKKEITAVGQVAAKDPFKGVTEGAQRAEAAAAKAGARARDTRGRFTRGGGIGGGGAGGGAAAGGLEGGARAIAGITAGASGALGQVSRLAAGLLTVASVLGVIAKADALTTLDARLRLATDSTEDFTRAQAELFAISQRSRTSLSETVALYTRIALATKDAKVGQDTLLEVVETINQATQLSGSSAQAAEQALVQLGQGLASGTLRGEELNSVLEQTPALADAIAKGMGITRGELRKFGQEGKISAQQVIEALQKQRAEVAAQFAQLPTTVGQAITKIGNASLRLLGTLNETSGTTKSLADTLSEFAEFLQSDEVLGAVAEFAAAWTQAFQDLVRDAKEALQLLESATREFFGGDEGVVSLIGRAFKELPINLRASVKIITALIAGMVDTSVANFTLMRDAFLAIFTDDTIDQAIERRNRKVQAAAMAATSVIEDALAERDRALRDAQQVGQGTVFARRAAEPAKNRSGKGRFTNQLSDEERRKLEAAQKAAFDREERSEKDHSDRLLRLLENRFSDSLIAASEYYRERERIELEALDKAIAIERRRLAAATDAAARTKALSDIEILERQKADVRLKAARDLAAATRALDDELNQARAQSLENAGRSADAARIRLEAQFRDLLKRLEAAGNLAGVAIVKGLINSGVAKAEFDDLKQQFDRTLTELQARQGAIADQQRTGALATGTAAQQQSEARRKAITELEVLNQKMAELAQRTGDPAIVEGAARATEAIRQLAIDSATGIEAALNELRASLLQLEEQFAGMVTGAGVNALSQLFLDLADSTKSAKESIKDFVLNFVRSMAEIAARALATFAVLTLLDSIFPGIGQAVALGARVKHSGGDPGQGVLRQVSPLAFIGAPRLHDGTGMLGLKAGEIPAILQEGEQVLSREQANQAGAGGGGDTRIVNLWDPSMVADWMTSSQGERVILNIIERNSGAVRQKISG